MVTPNAHTDTVNAPTQNEEIPKPKIKSVEADSHASSNDALWVRAIVGLGAPVASFLSALGDYALFCKEIFYWLPKRPFRIGLVLEQMSNIGFGSLFIVVLTGLFTGLVIGIQSLVGFERFGAEALVGPATVVALARELGPVFTGLMVSGRSGSGMATELGTMKVSEQIDAMASLAVNPIQYLVVPRLIASIIMMPLLASIFTGAGFIGSYLVVVVKAGTDPGIFLSETFYWADPVDFIEGYMKALVFGFLIATFSCYRGYYASGGARGVGQASTEAVVFSSVSVFISSYCVTEILQPILHNIGFDALPL